MIKGMEIDPFDPLCTVQCNAQLNFNSLLIKMNPNDFSS